MRVRPYVHLFTAITLASLLAGCPAPGTDLEQPLEPFTVGIEIRGGNNDHTPFKADLELTLDGTEVEIVGEIPRVDLPPTRLLLRDGNIWDHFQNPGTEIARYPLSAEWDGPVDLSGSMTLTEGQARDLRNGLYYIEIDTNFPALGAVAPSDELRAAGGRIQVNLSGIPANDSVWVEFLADFPHVNGGPGAEMTVPGTTLADLMYGEYAISGEDGAEAPRYELDGVVYVADVSPRSVTVGADLSSIVDITFEGVPDAQGLAATP